MKKIKLPQGVKLALVTGASSGIGKEFCFRLAQAGVDLVMVSNQPAELTKCSAQISEFFKVNVTTFDIDLSRRGAAQQIMTLLEAQSLRPDVLINNAGIFSFNTLLDTPIEKIRCFIDLHVDTVTELTLLMAAAMKEWGRGWILNMSSMSCWMPMPGIAMYAATKAYIRVFSRAMAYELKGSPVSLTVACPGGIATNLFGLPPKLMKLAVAIHAIQTPEKFTRKALKKMFKRKMQYINGFINRLGILFVALTPTRGRLLVKSKMLDKNIRRP